MHEREKALTRLLHVREPGEALYRAAVDAVVAAYMPHLAGIARFHDHGTDLLVEHGWCAGACLEPFSWNIAPGLLRDIVGSGDAQFQRELPVEDLPGAHHLNLSGPVWLLCELVTCGKDIVGLVFWIADDGAALEANGIGHLSALRISAELEHDADRRARRESERQYNDVATMAFDWFWEMDAEFRFTHLSDRWREITGLHPSKYLGKSPAELGADTTTGRWAAFYEALKARQPARGLGTRTVAADGSMRYWKVNGKPNYGDDGEFIGYRGTGTDVTAEVLERRRAEKAERLLHQAIEAIPQGFMLFDEKDTLVVSNRSYKKLYPEIAEELVPGADFVDLVKLWSERTDDRPDGVTPEQLYQRRIRAHRSRRRNFEHTRADGTAFLIDEQKTDDGSTVWMHTDISALKRREAELQALSGALADKNNQMDITINAMTDGLVMYDAENRLVLWNRHFQEMFSFTDDQLVEGLPGAAISEHKHNVGIMSGKAEDVSRKWTKVREQGELTYKRRLDDGRMLEVKGVRMADDGIVMTFHDITLAEEQAQALRDGAESLESTNRLLFKQNAYFDATLNSMIQGLATFDTKDRLMVCNRRFQELFQLPDRLVVEGTTVQEIAECIERSGAWTDAGRKIAKAHSRARESGFEDRSMRLDDGRSFDVQNNLLDNGDLLITFHEITDLEQHAQTLKDYADKLEFSNRELQEFAYVASHDLQEPLRKIEAFSDRLKKKYADVLDGDGLVYVERMQGASARMRTLIGDLLDYSRITTKAKPLGPVDLEAIVGAAVSDLEIAIETSGATVRHSGLPVVTGDATQMRQVFQNLISNALKFRKPDVAPEIEITAKPAPVSGEAEQRGPMIEIHVCDNGIGFDNKYADQIFKIFHRLHGRSEYEGTGIGLATCRKIMDRHGGTISASSEPGAGTTVSIVVPAGQPISKERENV